MSETTWKQYGHPNEGIVAMWETHSRYLDLEPGTVVGHIFQGVRNSRDVFVVVAQADGGAGLYCQAHDTLEAAQDDFEFRKQIIEEQIRNGVIQVRSA